MTTENWIRLYWLAKCWAGTMALHFQICVDNCHNLSPLSRHVVSPSCWRTPSVLANEKRLVVKLLSTHRTFWLPLRLLGKCGNPLESRIAICWRTFHQSTNAKHQQTAGNLWPKHDKRMMVTTDFSSCRLWAMWLCQTTSSISLPAALSFPREPQCVSHQLLSQLLF